jgi:hypothetical protein
VTAGAFVGGDVVYLFGNMVSRHAFRSSGNGSSWTQARYQTRDHPGGDSDQDDWHQRPVLVRVSETVNALHAVCAHAGGPLRGHGRR